MSISSSKRNLIFGRISAEQPIRPPWALVEDEFIETCNRCGECTRQCSMNILQMADGGFPVINFSQSGCDFCGVCVDVCEPKALNREKSEAFNLQATIAENCFSQRGVICRSCGEACHIEAIRFQLVVGGTAHVSLDGDSSVRNPRLPGKHRNPFLDKITGGSQGQYFDFLA